MDHRRNGGFILLFWAGILQQRKMKSGELDPDRISPLYFTVVVGSSFFLMTRFGERGEWTWNEIFLTGMFLYILSSRYAALYKRVDWSKRAPGLTDASSAESNARQA